MADHAVTESYLASSTSPWVEPVKASKPFITPLSQDFGSPKLAPMTPKEFATPLSQASTAPDFGSPMLRTFSSDFDEQDSDEDVLKPEISPEELSSLLLSSDPVAESYFINAKEVVVKPRHCPDEFDEGVFELLSPTHAASKATVARFSSVIEKPISTFSSSLAESACKGERPVENEDMALWLLSGSPAAAAYFIGAQEELEKTRHCPDVLDWDVFELLSESHIPSADILKRFESCAAKPVHTFSSSRAEFPCKMVPSLEDEDLALCLLSGSPAAAANFIGAQEELAKTCHCPDVLDWDVFELLSESHIPSADILKRFESCTAKPVHTFSSSRAEFACQMVLSLEDEDLALRLLSGSPAAAAYFIGAQEELAKTCHCPDVLDWDVFELLSESHIPSADILRRFESCTAKPVHTFSSSRAEFACQMVPSLGDKDLALWLLSDSPAAAAYFIGAQEELAKTCHCPDVLDWDVFELLSESRTPSADILERFPSCTAKPVHIFSSSRAEFSCQMVPSLEVDESM